MKQSELENKVKHLLERVLEGLRTSNRPRVPEIPVKLEEYWHKTSAGTWRIVVSDKTTNREAPDTIWASTLDGCTFYFWESVVRDAPDWVLETIIAHELGHAFLYAIGDPLLAQERTASVEKQVENRVGEGVEAWGFTRNNEADSWLREHIHQI